MEMAKSTSTRRARRRRVPTRANTQMAQRTDVPLAAHLPGARPSTYLTFPHPAGPATLGTDAHWFPASTARLLHTLDTHARMPGPTSTPYTPPPASTSIDPFPLPPHAIRQPCPPPCISARQLRQLELEPLVLPVDAPARVPLPLLPHPHQHHTQQRLVRMTHPRTPSVPPGV